MEWKERIKDKCAFRNKNVKECYRGMDERGRWLALLAKML
jgi:hypothetical protein